MLLRVFLQRNSRALCLAKPLDAKEKATGSDNRTYLRGKYQRRRHHSLRLLLLAVRGATSFQDIRNVGGILHPTFKLAAIARNLLADDSCWDLVIQEKATYQMANQLRYLFVVICLYNQPSNVTDLFYKQENSLMEDFLRHGHDTNIATNLTLKSIDDKFQTFGFNNVNFELLEPNLSLLDFSQYLSPDDERLEDSSALLRVGEIMKPNLNQDKKNGS